MNLCLLVGLMLWVGANAFECMQNCDKCSNPYTCDLCEEEQTCCQSTCHKCVNQITCNECVELYTLEAKTGICIIASSCDQEGCGVCSDNVCQKCNSGYLYDQYIKTCEACPDNC